MANSDRLFSSGADDWLALKLPSGPERSVMDNLRRWLPAAARYDAERFRAELQPSELLPSREQTCSRFPIIGTRFGSGC